MTLPKFLSSRTPVVISVCPEEGAEVEDITEDEFEDKNVEAEDAGEEIVIIEEAAEEDVPEDGVPHPASPVPSASVTARKIPVTTDELIFMLLYSFSLLPYTL